MTTSIRELPPPYPNQALARSQEFTEVDPQKLIREKTREAQEIDIDAAASSGNSGDDDAASSGNSGDDAAARSGNGGDDDGSSGMNIIA